MGRFEIDQKAFDNIFERFKKAIPKWHAFVEISFLPDEIEHEEWDARRDDYICEIPWDHYKTIINP